MGKSTLAQMVVDARAGVLVKLGEPGAMESARRDPDGFLDQGDGRLFAIDEVQRVPELVRALKASGGAAFVAGVLLHPSSRSFPFGDRLWSTPLDAL